MADPLDLADYDFELPPDRIAQQPLADRDGARLLVLERSSGRRAHRTLRELPELLSPGDLIVVNRSRVLPARLRGRKQSGGGVEALLLAPQAVPGHYEALVRVSGRLKAGTRIVFTAAGRAPVPAEIVAVSERGPVTLAFPAEVDPYAVGEMPLPPYIARQVTDTRDAQRYQTIFAKEPGSVAAPTAGLHVTESLQSALAERGIGWAEVVLHVGAGTFRPIGTREIERGELHDERYELPAETAEAIAQTRRSGGRIVAVGTTTTRTLETCADGDGVRAARGETRLFLKPGDRFAVVDALLTNFHLPRSSLLLLVAAFAGREAVLDAYREAIAERYRFYSYGDAMLVI